GRHHEPIPILARDVDHERLGIREPSVWISRADRIRMECHCACARQDGSSELDCGARPKVDVDWRLLRASDKWTDLDTRDHRQLRNYRDKRGGNDHATVARR